MCAERIPLTALAQQAVAEVLNNGDMAVDATLGNGHDTLFLARQVGANGQVYGFDVQSRAIDQTRAALTQAGLAGRCQLFHCGHEAMRSRLPETTRGRIGAVMFNLGYLPGGDKQLVSRTESSLAALSQAAELLRPGGIISVLAYTGHPGGQAEADAVTHWAEQLSAERFETRSRAQDKPGAPVLLLVWRR